MIDLPEWTEETALYIMAGVELVAFRHKGGKWNIKTSRCNMCGKCCMNFERHSFPLVDGRCIHLKKEPGKDNQQWLCGFGISRPFGCCIGIPLDVEECTEKYEELDNGC